MSIQLVLIITIMFALYPVLVLIMNNYRKKKLDWYKFWFRHGFSIIGLALCLIYTKTSDWKSFLTFLENSYSSTLIKELVKETIKFYPIELMVLALFCVCFFFFFMWILESLFLFLSCLTHFVLFGLESKEYSLEVESEELLKILTALSLFTIIGVLTISLVRYLTDKSSSVNLLISENALLCITISLLIIIAIKYIFKRKQK